MLDANAYCFNLAKAGMKAASAFVTAKNKAEVSKAALIDRLVNLAVARVVVEDGATGKTVARWIGETVQNDDCKATLASYRSAIAWRLDSATVAGLRAAFGPASAHEPGEAFDEAVTKLADTLGEVWAAYKARPKDEPAPAAATEHAQAAPITEAEVIRDARAEALACIAEIVAAGDFEALEDVATAVQAAFDAMTAPVKEVKAA